MLAELGGGVVQVVDRKFRREDCLFGDNALLVEEVYDNYEGGLSELPEGWDELFSGVKEHKVRPSGSALAAGGALKGNTVSESAQQKITDLMHFYRAYGHMAADLDPLKMEERANLDHGSYLSMNSKRNYALWEKAKFSEKNLLKILKETYCGKIGFEFMHIRSMDERLWIQDKIENMNISFSAEEQKEILWHLQETEMFEQFLHVRFPGYKRFSIEGGDAMVVSLEKLISLAPGMGIREIVIGMSHRGRLSVMTKVVKKPYAAMLHEFAGGMAYPSDLGVTGDVKYHLGCSNDRKVDGQSVYLSLSYNPSHLEAVNPVVMGRVRARMDRTNESVIGVLVHGDAAFIGQGVVAEGLTISGVKGYSSGGCVHVVVNNQVGFTTSPDSARSSLYCSDMARMIDAPVFHVNGDDPEVVAAVTQLALEYRNKFKKDVVVDMVCYRRYGHNEGDEPMFTQPLVYNRIAEHKTVAALYADKLIGDGVVTSEQVGDFRKQFRGILDEALVASADYKPKCAMWFEGYWAGLRSPPVGEFGHYLSDTGVEGSKLTSLAGVICSVPEGFQIDKKIARMLNARLNSIRSDSIDWGTGEALAFATLLVEKRSVRLSGEDCGRGTFSHRHARLVDQVTGAKYVPLNNLGVEQGSFEILDSPLSEYAVMGFEYGYSLDSPHALVMWEAQFGDFANGAQIIIDQFIAASETKWLRCSGLVLLLPHGYEGQGSEHSSARIERFLQLCAEDNMQVVNCTTPANYFHVLRRQLHRDFRKPLVVFTPKSLLRHKMAVSKLSDFSGGFLPVIGDGLCADSRAVKRVIICSGKVYYDLCDTRGDRRDVALLRLEQYYPFPKDFLSRELAKYPKAQVVWCQEEHKNMGGWSFVRDYIEESMAGAGMSQRAVSYIGRAAAASTAAGYASVHAEQQQKIMMDSFSF